MAKLHHIAALLAATLTCQSAEAQSKGPLADLGKLETLRFSGTEPFWGGRVRAGRLIFKTPENEKGETFRVRRTVRPHAIDFSGAMSRGTFTMLVTLTQCSDGMSDLDYPYEVTIRYARETLHGCGWSARRPYKELTQG